MQKFQIFLKITNNKCLYWLIIVLCPKLHITIYLSILEIKRFGDVDLAVKLNNKDLCTTITNSPKNCVIIKHHPLPLFWNWLSKPTFRRVGRGERGEGRGRKGLIVKLSQLLFKHLQSHRNIQSFVKRNYRKYILNISPSTASHVMVHYQLLFMEIVDGFFSL